MSTVNDDVGAEPVALPAPTPAVPNTDEEKLIARRTFLRWATGLSAVVSAALVGTPTVRAFLSPAFRRPGALTWTKLADVASVEVGVPLKVDFTETVNDAWVVSRAMRSVWVYTPDGKDFTVFNGRCTHLGCGFAYDATEKMFACPCHQGRFDVKTGARVAGPPPRGLDRLQVKVEGGAVYAAYQDFRLGVPDKVAV